MAEKNELCKCSEKLLTRQSRKTKLLEFLVQKSKQENKAKEFIKGSQIPKSKLLGVVEMPGKSIDVTCKSCDNVLELYKKDTSCK